MGSHDRASVRPPEELARFLEIIIQDIHNAATILQFYQKFELAQQILDAAGEINKALNILKGEQL